MKAARAARISPHEPMLSPALITSTDPQDQPHRVSQGVLPRSLNIPFLAKAWPTYLSTDVPENPELMYHQEEAQRQKEEIQKLAESHDDNLAGAEIFWGHEGVLHIGGYSEHTFGVLLEAEKATTK